MCRMFSLLLRIRDDVAVAELHVTASHWQSFRKTVSNPCLPAIRKASSAAQQSQGG
jgi:prophage antirepressor-like protein